jgi:FkbM family methyltransferase
MKLIFDIGANVGSFADAYSAKYPDAKIILIEANQNLCHHMSLKYANNPNIYVLNYAASHTNDVDLDFYICEGAHTISTASRDWIENSRFTNSYTWNNAIKVKTITIDELIKRYGNPDLIKVDVENYEYEALQGLTTKQKDVCFEWADEQYESTNKCCIYLQSLGYDNFGFVELDDPLTEPSTYTTWETSDFHEFGKAPQLKWGMVWAK